MQFTALKLNHLLENLDEEDYAKAVSYIEFLVDNKKKEKIKKGISAKEKIDVEAVVTSLIGAIPDTGKTLDEYRNERLKKYETFD